MLFTKITKLTIQYFLLKSFRICINQIVIKRFRSISSLKLEIDPFNNYITICGENNAGKTNTLRAINLFFNEESYKPNVDAPYHKYEGSRGGAVFPEITIKFVVNDTHYYTIQKRFDINGIKSVKTTKQEISTRRKENLEEDKTRNFLNKIAFFYLTSR